MKAIADKMAVFQNRLAALEFIDQETARQILPVAEAVANMFTILYYQAETGRVTPEDFELALTAIRQATRN
ncbi:type I toxin-antitoxin system ptaRNA1 family toxin [Salinivibrio socompensis]|uniref:type I toxin-antitoxin system ptaRNA1 family toxin n=1 Tax=Salinivibrio socompensis TaxID=1510206 RepID=UPI00046FCCE5|nr:type I toxin-antitoxin system ptaRNA1 family toxin [Salinivibrio socompensis]